MKRIAIAAVAALLFAPASAGADTMRMDTPTGRPHRAADAAFGASMKRMMSAMAVKTTGNPDRDFVLMMVPHHRGAVEMARVELRYGRDPELRRLAERVVAAQQSEIAEMRGWLGRNRR